MRHQPSARRASLERITPETQMQVSVAVEGTGTSEIDTGVPELDRLLALFAGRAFMDWQVKARAAAGAAADFPQLASDVGIVMGQALKTALGGRDELRGDAWCLCPVDEVLVRAALDLNGTIHLEFRVDRDAGMAGELSFHLCEAFVRGLAGDLGANVHLEVLYGDRAGPVAEALCGALGRCLDEACRLDPRLADGPPRGRDGW